MPDLSMPESFADITPAWLTKALRAGGAIQTAAVVSCEKQTIGEGVGFMGQLARCNLTYDRQDDGAPATVVAKLPAPAPENRTIAGLFNFYEIETSFYRELAARTPLKTAASYYGAFQAEGKKFVLLLEDLPPSTVDQVSGCGETQAAVAVSELAKLHGTSWESPKLASLAWLPRSNDPARAMLAQGAYQQAWAPFVQAFGANLPPAMLDLGERFGPKVTAVMDQLGGSPWTLIHGDYRLDNLFFAPNDSLTVIDWQIISRGRGAFDLAYFLTGSLTPANRRAWEMELLHEYHRLLQDEGVKGYEFERLYEDYRRSVLFSFLYAVIVLGQLDTNNERGLAVFQATLERTVTAILELNAGELLP